MEYYLYSKLSGKTTFHKVDIILREIVQEIKNELIRSSLNIKYTLVQY
jgi:hypothetical protein